MPQPSCVDRPVPSVLSRPSCLDRPVPSVLSRPSCPVHPALTVLCPDRPALTVLSVLSRLGRTRGSVGPTPSRRCVRAPCACGRGAGGQRGTRTHCLSARLHPVPTGELTAGDASLDVITGRWVNGLATFVRKTAVAPRRQGGFARASRGNFADAVGQKRPPAG